MPEEHRGNRSTVAVPNPLSAEESFLRGAMVPVLLRRLEHNYARGRRNVRLFEVGTVFRMADGAERAGDPRDAGLEAYGEESRLALVMTGAAAPPHWSGEAPDLDLWDLKGTAAQIAERLCGAAVEAFEPGADARADELGGAWLGPEAFRIAAAGVTIGVAGSVRPPAIDAPPWAGAVWALELELDAIRPHGVSEYRPFSLFPAIRRDLAVLVPRSAVAAEIERAIRDTASDLLESVRLFDVYEGGESGSARRSLGWAFRFRANDRTLTDEDVEAEMTTIAAALEKRFDARIRTS